MPGFGRHSQLVGWLGGGFVILAVAIGVFYGHLPLAVLALGAALLPSFVAGGFAISGARARPGLRGSLELLSGLALGSVLFSEHSVLPFWLVVLGAGYTIVSLLLAVLTLLVWREGRNKSIRG